MAGFLNAWGYDVYGTSQLLKRFTDLREDGFSAGTLKINTGGRHSTNCLEIPGNFGNSDFRSWIRYTQGTLTTVYVGTAIKFPDYPPTPGQFKVFMSFWDVGSQQGAFALRPDGTFGYYRGQYGNGTWTLLGASTFVFSLNVWYFFACKVTFNNSTGVVEAKINNVSHLTLSSQDTVNGSNNQSISQISFDHSGSGASGQAGTTGSMLRLDDSSIRDDDWVVDSRVRESLPISVGDVDDGVPTGAADSEAATDETPPDDDTTYTSLPTVGDKILLNYDDIPTTANVLALINLPYSKKSDAGTAAFKALNKVNGTEYLSSVEKAPSESSFAYFPDVHMVSPDTSSAWTPSEVNGSQHGVERTQ